MEKMTVITEQLKNLLSSISDNAILDLAASRSAVAIFPEAGQAVAIDTYFASDLRDEAAEQYWEKLGPRATLALDVVDLDLVERSQDELEELLAQPLNSDMKTRAEQIRSRVLASDLEGAVQDALAEIQDRVRVAGAEQ